MCVSQVYGCSKPKLLLLFKERVCQSHLQTYHSVDSECRRKRGNGSKRENIERVVRDNEIKGEAGYEGSDCVTGSSN